MNNELARFFSELDQFDSPIPIDELKRCLGELSLDEHDVDNLICFSDSKYQRNLIRRTEHYEALLLCFESGQQTPIHDHAGSACGVRVICGTGTETCFQRNGQDSISAADSRELPAGGVVGCCDLDTHQLSNLREDKLITLHIYSPPLGQVANFSLSDNSLIYVVAKYNDYTSHCAS